MGIQSAWYNDDKTVIRWTFDRVWTWGDALETQLVCNEMIDTVDHTVHFLMDASRTNTLPIGSLQKIPEALNKRHPRHGTSIVVISKQSALYKLWQAFSLVLPSASKSTVVFFPSLEAAETYVASLSASSS